MNISQRVVRVNSKGVPIGLGLCVLASILTSLTRRYCALFFLVAMFGNPTILYGSTHYSREVLVQRAINRESERFRPMGVDVIFPPSIQVFGGVVAQTDWLGDKEETRVNVTLEIEPGAAYTGYIIASLDSIRARYRIPYSDLVPMALFVASGGTGLYTLWVDYQLPAEFYADAGFVKHDKRGSVAAEFYGTRFAKILMELDLYDFPGYDNDSALVNSANRKIAHRAHIVPPHHIERINNTYLNVDFGRPFIATIDNFNVRIDGFVARYTPSTTGGTYTRIEIARVSVFPDPERGDNEQTVRWEHYGGAEGRELLTEVHFLFDSLALLRAAKSTSDASWNRFMDEMRAPYLVDLNREPWYRYSRTYCSLHPEMEECSNFR